PRTRLRARGLEREGALAVAMAVSVRLDDGDRAGTGASRIAGRQVLDDVPVIGFQCGKIDAGDSRPDHAGPLIIASSLRSLLLAPEEYLDAAGEPAEVGLVKRRR